MKITILTYGSRGDVQPFLALAAGLQKAGHAVTLAAPHRFAGLITAHGIQCVPLAGNPDELSRMFNDAAGNTCLMVRSMQKHIFEIAPDIVREVRRAVQRADLVVHSFAFTTGGHSFARELGIPDISVQLFPVFAPTRAYPAVGAPQHMPGWLNHTAHWFSTQVFWHAGNLGYRRLRRQARADFPARVYWPFTPAADRAASPLLFAISPVVLPKPREWNLPHIYMPGYFFLDDQEFHPSDSLMRFLEAGDAPVCVTFGSMVNREAERIFRTVMEAVRRSANRAIFLTGWAGWQPETVPEYALFLESAPHPWLFPRCKSVVHHGGAGTTAAGLRSGVPSILIPHAADQPFWGWRVAAIGAGPKPISPKRLTVVSLQQALILADTEPMRRRAHEIGMSIRAENGVAQAVSLIQALG